MAFPFVKQPDSMDCGPSCLSMVAKYYGRDFSLQELRNRSQIGKQGVNMLGISEAAEAIGFRTQSLRLTYHAITKEANLPAIVHWNQNHFVVLYKVKKNKLFIADPAQGLVSFSPVEFKAHWVSGKFEEQEEGIALLLEPSSSFYENESDTFKRDNEELRMNTIFRYILPYKKLIYQLFAGLLVGSLLQLVLPFLTKSVIDVGVNTGNIHFVYIVLLAQLTLLLGRLTVDFVRSWILLHISTRINISILTDFLVKLMKLPMGFFDSKKTGDILQRMNDHSRIESFLTGPSLNILFSLVNLAIFSVVLAVFNVQLFVVVIIASVLYSSWVFLFLRKRKALDYRRFEVSSQKQNVTIQLIQGMQEIKLHGVEKSMRYLWESVQGKLFKLGIKGLSLNQWQQTGAFFINEGKNIFITFLSAKAVIDGYMTLGSMLAVQYIIGQLNSPIEQMIGFVQSWQNAKISIDRLNEIHKIEDEEPEYKNLRQELPIAFARQVIGGEGSPMQSATDLDSLEGIKQLQARFSFSGNEPTDTPGIIFQNMSFTYPGAGNEPVLKDISLKIPSGKTTAIVGMSGSGKTTLLKLLLKFYEPQRGDIKLDHISLNTISHHVWRSRCGVVMQDSFIFADTIARNIAIGADEIDIDKLQHAVDVANAGEFIDALPLGFNTKIGAEGVGISMGQKQRILIARAVYRDPDFIFLDEATNSLDANNETMIVKNLASFLKNRTVVVVAHRLSTVRHADQIVVINQGTITERGTHQELVNLKGEYFNLVRNQLELNG
ncbi:peptidase domain-containing ABC transporter [Chryseosolibacter indicus]|uniref:Peptidase domain-containing ABC transporter n=1 Tax=Chryseosolibacter indicus TaxID=2782351 RepID=A0ABS5VVR1_9BACT|nr:peptidase domain-containing ABC transporter [Chryseosolibacter indicus]MBT1705426.1 peptidase domain-containing ABC transporter [Chryseosolibacter indicus]